MFFKFLDTPFRKFATITGTQSLNTTSQRRSGKRRHPSNTAGSNHSVPRGIFRVGQEAGTGTGGERGIRTPETVSRLHAFQACAFDHSATSPHRLSALTSRRNAMASEDLQKTTPPWAGTGPSPRGAGNPRVTGRVLPFDGPAVRTTAPCRPGQIQVASGDAPPGRACGRILRGSGRGRVHPFGGGARHRGRPYRPTP